MRQVRKTKISVLFTLFFVFLFLLFGGVGGEAYAAEFVSGYTDVLDDLRKDEAFNVEDYPAVADDYSLQVIQIAESSAGELFIYVYQPAADISHLATQISMALSKDFENVADNSNVAISDINDSGFGGEDGDGHGGGGGSFHSLSRAGNSPALFDLTLLSCDGVFGKYIVNRFQVLNDIERYYHIVSIYRDWDSLIDKDTDKANDIAAVVYPVAKLYMATTLNGEVSYECIDMKIVEIIPESKHIGYFRYFTGFGIISFKDADCWYVGFDTVQPIDTLYEAEISFKLRTVETNYAYGIETNQTIGGSQSVNNFIVSSKEKHSVGNLFHKYTWDTIQTYDEFISNPDYNLSDSEKENMSGCKWVLRFLVTERKVVGDYKVNMETKVQVADLTVLRLKFETAGVVYNLGVVDNMQSSKPNQPPGNSKDPFDFWQWLANLLGVDVWAAKLIVYGVLAFLVLAIALPVLSVFFPIVGSACKAVLSGVWWVLSAPFRFVGWIIKKIKGGD